MADYSDSERSSGAKYHSKQKEEEYARHWLERIKKACEYYDKWEAQFKCKTLDKYIEGLVSAGMGCYYLNLFYSSIKVKKPNLLFSRPTFNLVPKPWKLDWNPEVAMTTAQLKEDTLNSFIQEYAMNFAEEIELAILDSWSYFGMLEVGYAANWIKNPNAGQPILKSDYYDTEGEKDGAVLREPDEIPEKEYIYFKRIPAHRFRVGGSDSHDMERCNWVGYYEFVRTEDLLANKKNLKNIDDKDWPQARSDDYYFDSELSHEDEKEFTQKGDYTKIWKIWDLRSKVFSILLASPEKCIYKEDYKRLPLFGLRFDLRRKGWYPIPVTFNWKAPADEFNEARNQMKSHRRRTRNMWQAVEQTIDPDELEKFVHGPDFTIVFVKRDQAIQPINNPPIDSSIQASLAIASDEFDKISGTSNPQRGVSDRTTATEAATIEQRSRIREEVDRDVIANWLCAIGREALLIIMEKFTEPFWIKLARDVGEPGEEVQDIQQRYQLIHSAMLEDKVDFELDISVSSLSPVTNEIEKRKFLEFMSIIQNFNVLAMHPTLIREAAYRCDYRNEQVIRAIQQMAQLAIMAKAAEGQANLQTQGQQGGEISNAAQTRVQQLTPPDQEEIRQQIENQQNQPQVM